MRISDWSSDVCSSDLLCQRRCDALQIAALDGAEGPEVDDRAERPCDGRDARPDRILDIVDGPDQGIGDALGRREFEDGAERLAIAAGEAPPIGAVGGKAVALGYPRPEPSPADPFQK